MASDEQTLIDQETGVSEDTLDINPTLISDKSHSEESPPTVDASHSVNLNAPHLSNLPIELLFVVAQLKTTIKEASHIEPGHVFELNKKAIAQVEIRANGTPIGSGELVQVGDRAGVRILELYKRKQSD